MKRLILVLCLLASPTFASQYIYSNDGLSWRGAQDSESPRAGEVAFPDLANAGQLAAAFPGYSAAIAVQTALAQGQTDLVNRVGGGIVITSTGTPGINATYALDSVTMDQIGSVARDVSAGLGLPGGGSTFTYPDAASNPKTLTATNVVDLYKAMRDLLLVLNTQAQVEMEGGQPSWPSQAVTIP